MLVIYEVIPLENQGLLQQKPDEQADFRALVNCKAFAISSQINERLPAVVNFLETSIKLHLFLFQVNLKIEFSKEHNYNSCGNILATQILFATVRTQMYSCIGMSSCIICITLLERLRKLDNMSSLQKQYFVMVVINYAEADI